MDIILLERIEKLGTIGDVVTVKDGYARNFLLPNKKALRANESNRKVFESNRARIEEENEARRKDAEKHSNIVDGKQIVLIRASSNSGQLYGSVAVRDIVEALNEDGADVAKAMIVLERPIKSLGIFDVRVALHPEVSVTVQVNVARSPEEADQQKEGIDVLADMFETEPDQGFTEVVDPNAEPGEVAVAETDDEAAAQDASADEDKADAAPVDAEAQAAVNDQEEEEEKPA